MRKSRHLLPLLVVVALVALALPLAANADEARVVSAFGCSAQPQPPEIGAGGIVARARLICLTATPGRQVFTAILQQQGDGSYEMVPASGGLRDAPDARSGAGSSGDGAMTGRPLSCRPVKGSQQFVTAVMIGDGSEHFRQAVFTGAGAGSFPLVMSGPSALPRDCFNGDLETFLSPEDAVLVAACETLPMSDEEVAASHKRAKTLLATPPAARPADPLRDALADGYVISSELPKSKPADKATIAAISTLEEEFADCYNAGALRSVVALLAGDLQSGVVDFYESAGPRCRLPLRPPLPVPGAGPHFVHRGH